MSGSINLRSTYQEAISTVYSRLPGTLIVNVINAILIIVAVEGREISRPYLIWICCIVVVSLLRAWKYLQFVADVQHDANIRYWSRISVIGALSSGILWGVGPVLPFAPFVSSQWLWAFAIGGMCAGAASLYAAHLPTAMAFTIPASLPLAILLMLQGTLPGFAAAAMTIAFIGLTTFTTILFSREFSRLQSLQSNLGVRAQQLDVANQRLSREMEEHRSTSQALYQVQKMEALGNLTSGFAHDFNNILTVIIGNLETINNRLPLESTRLLSQAAITAAESGADLISRLLAFARKQTLEICRCNVIAVVEDFRPLLLHAVNGDVQIRFDLREAGLIANIDVAQFQAVLLNLVVNARDAMPHGGTITIAVASTYLDAQFLNGTDIASGDFVAISVTDTGQGMPQHVLERAFEPFFTTKGDRGGSGLGLAQVYGFARQSGGLGRIDSVVGSSTCVTIYLPVVQNGDATEAATSAAGDAVQCMSALSVLLVDDNEAVLSAIQAGLAEESWTITCATNAQAAIGAVETGKRFDLVVSDIDMPGAINGRGLAAQLRSRYGIPVLLISGDPASLANGPDPFPILTKPFRKQALIQKIQDVVAEAKAQYAQ
jgi:signal transduction histidine kinase